MSTPIQLRFNKQAIQNLELPAPGSRATVHDTVVNGLQLRVTSSGVKSFCVLRRSKGGDPERITLGCYSDLSVELARTKNRIDPLPPVVSPLSSASPSTHSSTHSLPLTLFYSRRSHLAGMTASQRLIYTAPFGDRS